MTFSPEVVDAVLRHMNDDHTDDSRTIVRARLHETGIDSEITSVVMTGFDGSEARWDVTLADGANSEVVIAWPGGPITERAEVRREIVAITEWAHGVLGIPFERHS